MKLNTPVIFADGTKFFDELSKEFVRHDKGIFILAPSGSGKTYFITRQTTMDWIDGDYIWPAAGADLTSNEWNDDKKIVDEINNKSDVITNEAKKLGFWIIGSSNNFLKPDAIVIPKWSVHLRYILNRENNSYDGGATGHDLSALKSHRRFIMKWKKFGVPVFESVQEACNNFIK